MVFVDKEWPSFLLSDNCIRLQFQYFYKLWVLEGIVGYYFQRL